ncbi:hypothetical protein HII36_50070, partial [Nonomuraea sp. NN258]|nr:hypothetical protein [Nonomuraea antri]
MAATLLLPAALPAACGTERAPGLPAAVNAPAKVARCLLKIPDPRAGAAARAALIRDIHAYLATRPGRVFYAAYDLVSGATLGEGEHQHDTITASGVKVDILTALLRRDPGHGLDEGERDLATRMITESDNGAADTLWNRVGGHEGMAGFYRDLGMTETVPGPTQYWGGTKTSPADRIKLLRALAGGA